MQNQPTSKKQKMEKPQPALAEQGGPAGAPANPALRGKSYSAADVGLIEYFFKEKGWGAKKMVKENPGKPWSVSGVSKIVKKIKSGASLKRKTGSGGHNTKRIEANVAKVREIYEKTEGMATRGGSLRGISKELAAHGAKVGRTTVHQILRHDMEKKNYAQVATHRLSDKNKQARLDFCTKTLAAIEDGTLDLDRVVFSDETTVRCSDTTKNMRNSRVWVDKDIPRAAVPADIIC